VKLPFVDEHSLEVNASRENLWRALPGACGPTLVGFRVARAKAGEELALEGEHPFSRYALTFAIEEIGDDRLRLRASTHAAFPGRRGSLYRRLVIGSGIHAIVVPRMLGRIGAAAESGNHGHSRRPEPRASRIFGAATGAAAPLARLHFGRWAQCGFTSAHAALYRLGLAQQIGDAPILLLTTTGRKSGRPRTVPLMYVPAAAPVLVASNGGRRNHPSWYLNLMDDARASIEIGSRRTEVVARTVGGGERELLWERAVEIYPPYSEYQRRAERTLPVIVLQPAPPAAGPQNLAD
jgi:F420H(2)-dependent quinone reductase